MKLKKYVIKTMNRNDLKRVVDSLDITTVDRRDRGSMAKSVGRRQDIDSKYLMRFLTETQVKEVCERLGLEPRGRKNALIKKLLKMNGGKAKVEVVKKSSSASETSIPRRRDKNAVRYATGKTPVLFHRKNGRRMAKLTLAQLERHLFGAADILRGKMDASEFKEFIFGLLFLKRASDEFEARRELVLEAQLKKGRSQAEAEKRAESPNYYTKAFFVPHKARWSYIRDNSRKANVGDLLNKALAALEQENPGSLEGVLHHIDFTRTVGKSKIPDKRLQQLIDHFNRYRLQNEDFEFPDLLGAAYEYLIGEFADSAGKKGGEFYTPRAVVRMMVRLAEPQEGMKVYDPCSGSGGMLILSHEYVAERGGDPRNLGLYGQEDNGGVWSISKMNMILHGIADADLRNDDTLAAPQHKEGGELMRFDRVITNPPFSQNYNADGIPFPERFQYGWCPTSGKKADLMFVQHMVSVMRPKGMVVTVMPHGVLFRGGAEKEIRAGFIKDDLLDAVIGLAPNLFYGTGIPASILVLRAKGAKPKDRRGKVLFINADAEFRSGRAQNYLEPEHIEKIVSAYRRCEDIPGFASVVSHEDLAQNDYNLNIRRYADNAPPPEPQDVRAHLLGGVPKAEVKASRELFEAHGFNPRRLFTEKDEKYLNFAPAITAKSKLKTLVEEDQGINVREAEVTQALEKWWAKAKGQIVELPETQNLMTVRADFLEFFEKVLVPAGLLDRFKVAGVIASWWNEAQYDLKTLAARGFAGVVEGWVATISHALEENGNKTDPLDHKLVKRLLPEFTEQIAEVESKVSELDGTIKAAKQAAGEDDEEQESDGDDEENLSEEDLKAIRKDLKAEKKKLKALKASLVERLARAQSELGADQARELVLDLLNADLSTVLDQAVTIHCQAIVATVESWWDKYRVTLRDIEGDRDEAKKKLDGFLKELGYA